MGMFDSFIFAADVLPDNSEPPTTEFQTKELECELDLYTVNSTGRLYRSRLVFTEGKPTTRSFPQPEPLTKELLVTSYERNRMQVYSLVFENGWLMHSTKVTEETIKAHPAHLLQSFSPD